MVASETRKACAISAVVSPHTSRSVSATCASRASAGWQQVNTSRSRSSGITSGSSVRRGAELAELERLVEVARLDQVVASERFLGLGERPVGDDVAADRGGGRGRLQRVAAEDRAAGGDDLLGEAPVGLHHRLPEVGRRGGVGLFIFVDEDHVLGHGVSSSGVWFGPTPTRRTVAGGIDNPVQDFLSVLSVTL